MKKLLIIIFSIISFISYSQTETVRGNIEPISTILDLKLNISDTTNMLDSYAKKGEVGGGLTAEDVADQIHDTILEIRASSELGVALSDSSGTGPGSYVTGYDFANGGGGLTTEDVADQIHDTIVAVLAAGEVAVIAGDSSLTGEGSYVTEYELLITGDAVARDMLQDSSVITENSSDVVDDVIIDWGISTNQVSAIDIPVADADGHYSATDVENALKEIMEYINTLHDQIDPILPYNTYYVSNSGNDANDGLSTSTPWRTIAKVNSSTFVPTDHIAFKKGDTWRETLTVPSSGTDPGVSDSSITFTSYGAGAKPRMLGSTQIATWVDQPAGRANVWAGTTTVNDPMDFSYGGGIFFIEPDDSVKWCHIVSDNFDDMTVQYDWFWQNDTVYIYSATNPNTASVIVEAEQRNEIFILDDQEWLIIDGLEFAYSAWTGIHDQSPAVNVDGLEIRNCELHHISDRGGLGHCIEVWHSHCLIENNVIYDGGRRNLSMNTYAAGGVNMHEVVIQHNTFYHGHHTTALDLGVNSATSSNDSIIFRYNYVYDDLNQAIDNVEIFSSQPIYAENTVVGGSITKVYIYGNIFQNMSGRTIHVNGDNIDFHVWNNTFYGPGNYVPNYTFMILWQGDGLLDLKNNLFYIYSTTWASTYGYFYLEDVSGFSAQCLDYNMYYNAYNTRLGYYGATQYGTNTFGTYQSTESQEANGSIDDPEFVNAPTDFSLQVGSPAINAGVDLGLTEDYYGNPIVGTPDIGAIEKQ